MKTKPKKDFVFATVITLLVLLLLCVASYIASFFMGLEFKNNPTETQKLLTRLSVGSIPLMFMYCISRLFDLFVYALTWEKPEGKQ